MITFAVLVLIVSAAARGFRKGAPSELVDLIFVGIGFPIAFRAGAPVGERLFGDWAPIASRTLGALVVFSVLSLVGAGVRKAVTADQTAPPDPGLGALIGGIRGLLVAIVAIAIVAAAPAGSALGQLAQRSTAVSVLGDPSGPAMTVFGASTGEDGMIALIEFNRAFPDGPLITDDFRQIPAFESDELMTQPAAGAEILALVNQERSALGVPTLTWSSFLTDVGTAYAHEMYEGGFFAHNSPRSGDVGDRLNTAAIRYRVAGENLALAPNVNSVHTGLMNSPGHRANIVSREYTHVGIGVVEGPIGLLVVQVFLAG